MVLLIIIPMKNGYFIGNINPTFSDKPTWSHSKAQALLRPATEQNPTKPTEATEAEPVLQTFHDLHDTPLTLQHSWDGLHVHIPGRPHTLQLDE